MSDIDGMTKNEISEEIRGLRQLGRLGKITPMQADRLGMLEAASQRISSATRRRSWKLW